MRVINSKMKCKHCGSEIIEREWIKIPELKIEVEKDVHDKNKSWNELKLGERESELLTAEECIFLANSKYAGILKMDGSSSTDNFFIQQPFKLNKKNNLITRFDASSGRVYLGCNGDADGSYPSLGVRFKRKLK